MNCIRCNTPLVGEARFCRNCGQPVSNAAFQPTMANNAQVNQPGRGDSAAVLPLPWQAQQTAPLQPHYTPPQSVPQQAYQPMVASSPNPGSLPSTGAQFSSPPLPRRRRKRRLGQVLLILAIILLVLVAGWFLALRPLLHGIAQSQIDGVLSNEVNQINPIETALIPPGQTTVRLSEGDMNNFIAFNTSSSDPVQQINVKITPAGLRLDFQVYGFPCTVTGVPKAFNGQLIITNVTVQGVASILMSPDEMTSTLNAHLGDAVARLHRSVIGVQLNDQEMDIQLR
jgi:hypothetical protein